jgi:hypothetical protein
VLRKSRRPVVAAFAPLSAKLDRRVCGAACLPSSRCKELVIMIELLRRSG